MPSDQGLGRRGRPKTVADDQRDRSRQCERRKPCAGGSRPRRTRRNDPLPAGSRAVLPCSSTLGPKARDTARRCRRRSWLHWRSRRRASPARCARRRRRGPAPGPFRSAKRLCVAIDGATDQHWSPGSPPMVRCRSRQPPLPGIRRSGATTTAWPRVARRVARRRCAPRQAWAASPEAARSGPHEEVGAGARMNAPGIGAELGGFAAGSAPCSKDRCRPV